MSTLTVFTSVTLDGVMQAPGRPDEDTRGGFPYGGWAGPYSDETMGRVAAEGMAQGPALLFGRRTYEDFFKVWPGMPQPNPFTDVLNNAQKYVASRTLAEPLPWQNSTLLHGDAAAAVADLKARETRDLLVLGSGDLVQTLMRNDLVDRFTLLIHPLVLGTGRRLFNEGNPLAKMELERTTPTKTGVVIASYRARATATTTGG